ncbi:hypothetical protein ACWKSP_35555 [Micromonosporaceae bacterium Da 78-11]
MIFVFAAAIVRYRRRFLVAGLTLATAAVPATANTTDEKSVVFGFLGALGLLVATCIPVTVVEKRDFPALLIGPGPALRTPRGAAFVLLGLLHLTAVTMFVALGTMATSEGPDRRAWLFLVLGLGLPLPMYFRGLWRGIGVTLGPAGLTADLAAGSLFVPWDAFATDQPVTRPGDNEAGLLLALARPELVTRTGLSLRRRLVSFDGPGAGVLAGAIRHYVAHPSDRAEIGTASGYERLFAAGPEYDATAEPGEPPSVRRRVVESIMGALLAVLGFGGGLIFKVRFQRLDWYGVTSHTLFWLGLGGLCLIVNAVTGKPKSSAAPPVVPPPAAGPEWARDVTNG